jgi:hypothetical protein
VCLATCWQHPLHAGSVSPGSAAHFRLNVYMFIVHRTQDTPICLLDPILHIITGFEIFISGLSHNSSVFSSFYDNIVPLQCSYDTDSSYCETHDLASRDSILTHSSPPIVLNCKGITFVFKSVKYCRDIQYKIDNDYNELNHDMPTR